MRNHGAELTDGAHALETRKPVSHGAFTLSEPIAFFHGTFQLSRAFGDEPPQTPFVEEQEAEPRQHGKESEPPPPPERFGRHFLQISPGADLQRFFQGADAVKVARAVPVEFSVSRFGSKERTGCEAREFRIRPGKSGCYQVGIKLGRMGADGIVVRFRTDHPQRAPFNQVLGFNALERADGDDACVKVTGKHAFNHVGHAVAQITDGAEELAVVKSPFSQFHAYGKHAVDRGGQRRGDMLAAQICEFLNVRA